jgi:hypothetical protein
MSTTVKADNLIELRNELSRWMELTGTSQRQTARRLGVSQGTLSAWLQGTYPGKDDAVAERAASFLEREREKATLSRRDHVFVDTTASKAIYSVARMAHLDSEICVCCGPAGAGKTITVKQYAKHNPGTVTLIEADHSYTHRAFFSDLHKALGFPGRGSSHDMLADCIDKLRGTERLIIIDEAEHLPHTALDDLRRINDKAGCGLLFIGLPELIERIRGVRREYAYLYSRVGGYRRVDLLTRQDSERIVATYLPEAAGMGKAFHLASRGNARTLVKLIQRVSRVAARDRIEVTKEVIDQVAEILIV